MKICYVLPQMLRKPIGGYKMVYEYANRLVAEGHEVGILYLNENALRRFPIPRWMRGIAVNIFTLVEPRWFSLDRRIYKYSSTTRQIDHTLTRYDLAIATGVDTVEQTLTYFPNARKAYFIQDYENWVYSETQVNATYDLGMDNIVIAQWLKDIVDQYAQKPAILLRNPIDTDIYRVINPIEARNRYTIGVLYHDREHKGFHYAYETILRLKEKYPDLRVKMFGTSQPTFDIPTWIDFTLNATQEQTVEIYNSVALFLCSTVQEGFGLTGLEAMACGAALVSTEYDGVKEYAASEENALLSPVADVNALVRNAEILIENNDLRQRIAQHGAENARQFSWDEAMEVLNSYICGKNNE